MFTKFNGPDVYFKLGIVDPAFISHPKPSLGLLELFIHEAVFFF